MAEDLHNRRRRGRFPQPIGEAVPQLIRAHDGHLPRQRFQLSYPLQIGFLGCLRLNTLPCSLPSSVKCVRMALGVSPGSQVFATFRFISSASRSASLPFDGRSTGQRTAPTRASGAPPLCGVVGWYRPCPDGCRDVRDHLIQGRGKLR